METDSFEADLRQALSRRAAEVPGEAIERLRHLHYRPRTAGRAKIVGAGLAGAAAAVLAITVASSGSTHASPGSAPASSASPAQLTAYQATVLAKAHVTKAQVAALARSGFTTAQISALAAATAQLTQQDKNAITIARTAAGYLARYCTPAEQTALLGEGLKATQIAALAKAHLSAAQLAALASGS
jgi:hypothetical protein